MTTIVIASICGFVCGGLLGFEFFFLFQSWRDRYHSKQECQECLRTRVEFGFHLDGKEYRCVEKEK